jgi:hypothetical protein
MNRENKIKHFFREITEKKLKAIEPLHANVRR